MKGPAARNRQVILRCWVCPICGDVRLTQGQETTSPCLCCSDASRTVWMNLREGPLPEPGHGPTVRSIEKPPANESSHENADSPDQ